MVAAWQLWLSPRPTRRTNTAAQPAVRTAGDIIRYNFTEEDDGRHVVKETHFIRKQAVRNGNSGPPL